jgi:polyhydroxybutyrate depolymerase
MRVLAPWKVMQHLTPALLPSWLAACSSSAADAASASAAGSGGSSAGSRTEPSGVGTEMRSPVAAGGAGAGEGGSVDNAPSLEGPTAIDAEIDRGGEGASTPGASSDTPDDDSPEGDAEIDDAAACPMVTSASAMTMPGEVTASVTVGGATRTFIRRVPLGYTGTTPMPVVIDFHPRGGSAISWKGSTNWASVADARGFVVVWPDGIDNSWNVGERCCGPAHDQNVDDVAFTREILAALARDTCIDRRRIYATGCSNGGGMAYKLACSAADAIAAVAPVDFDCTTGPTNDPSCGGCSPARPISATQFRGTNDTVVPYNGGVSAVNAAITFPGAPANFATWAQINGCTGTPRAVPDLPSCETYPVCSAGVENTLCTVQNGTHCGSYDSFDVVNIAWEQMSKVTLP